MRSTLAGIRVLVLPFGAQAGTRIVLNGLDGTIKFYDETDAWVGLLSPDEWAIGDLDTPGARVTLDPSGGLRVRDANDVLASTLDTQGYTLRDTSTGLVVAEIRPGHIRLVDPDGTDDIELTTESAGSMPNPAYRSAPEASPGTSIVAPLAPVFTTTPADDLSVIHAAAWKANTVQAGTWTPPAGFTERLDEDPSPDDSTLAVSVATKDATTGAAATFVSSQSNWQQGIGSHVVIRGGGPVSPSFLSESHTASVFSTGGTMTFLLAKPPSVVQGNILLAFVSMGNDGGSVPTGWTTPDGWVFLGANVGITVGPPMSTLAVGVWAKLATASEPSTYSVTINMGVGRKTFEACIVAVQDAFLVEGGAHIRIAGHPIRRLLDQVELQSAAAQLCDFTDIAPGFDHLELVFTGTSDRSADALREVQMRFNGDTGANYNMQINRDNVLTQLMSTTRITAGAIDGAVAGHHVGNVIQIFNYAKLENRMVLGNGLHTLTSQLVEETMRGQWGNTTDPINEITVGSVGPTLFDAGSRAWLYGY